ncbi:hypothetical protein ACFQ1I_32740 [Kitasatospora arboriphila]
MDPGRVVDGPGVEEPGEEPLALPVPVRPSLGVVEEGAQVCAPEAFNLEPHALVAHVAVQGAEVEAVDQPLEAAGVSEIVLLAFEHDEHVEVGVPVGSAVRDGRGDHDCDPVLDRGQVSADGREQMVAECFGGATAQPQGVPGRLRGRGCRGYGGHVSPAAQSSVWCPME